MKLNKQEIGLLEHTKKAQRWKGFSLLMLLLTFVCFAVFATLWMNLTDLASDTLRQTLSWAASSPEGPLLASLSLLHLDTAFHATFFHGMFVGLCLYLAVLILLSFRTSRERQLMLKLHLRVQELEVDRND